MENTSSVFRLDAFWRFSKNQRHRLDINWFSLHREGSRTVGTDIAIEDPDGNEIQILDSSTVESYFDLDLYQGIYNYSLFFDDRLDIALKTGLYIAPIKMGLEATGFTETETREGFTAPLPTIGLRTDIAITPKWFLRSGTDVFYLKYNNYVGYIFSANAAIEYQPWKHIGIGTGFDVLQL
jgi:hypothetical protein